MDPTLNIPPNIPPNILFSEPKPAVQGQGEEAYRLNDEYPLQEVNSKSKIKTLAGDIVKSSTLSSSPANEEHFFTIIKNKTFSLLVKVKNVFLQLLGFPVEQDKSAANAIHECIKELENNLNAYNIPEIHKMRVKSTRIGNRAEIKKLIGIIKDQAQELKSKEKEAQRLGESYTNCSTYPKEINHVYRYAQRFEYREEIAHILQEIEEAVSDNQLPAADRLNTLQRKEEDFIKAVKKALKSDLILKRDRQRQKKLYQQLNGKGVSLENVYEVLQITYPGLAPPAFMLLNQSKDLKPQLEKIAIKQELQLLSKSVQQEVALHSINAQVELNEMVKVDERNKLLDPFEEFIQNERRFKQNLEDLQVYKEKLDGVILNPNTLKLLRIDLPLTVIKELRDILDQFAQVLKVIGPFSVQIDELNIEQLPKFAAEYVKTDFTAILNARIVYQQFNSLFLKDRKTQVEILKLCKGIRGRAPARFNNKMEDIDSLVASVFQRIARYPLTLDALLKYSPKDSAVYFLVQKCHQYASAWVDAVNRW